MKIIVTSVIKYVVMWARVSVDLNASIDTIQFGLMYAIATAVFMLLS